MHDHPHSNRELAVEAVIAGWLMGYAMALVSTAALTFLATRIPDGATVARWLPRELPPILLAVPISLATVLGWTFIGIVLGALYDIGDFGDRRGAVGSPSGIFTLMVAAVGWLPLPPLVVFMRRYWWLWVGMAILFVALFGWAMPWLAAR